MYSSKTKAFTLIELLAVIVILAVIALISSPIIINLIENARKESFKDTTYGIIGAGENLYAKELLDSNDFNSITFTYTNGVESSSVGGKELEYDGTKPRTGSVVINSDGKIAIAIHNGTWCTEKGFDDSEVILSEKDAGECIITDAGDNDYDIAEGVNKPKLTTGMTPVKWNGSAWVNTTESDSDWYNYTTGDKKWANAKTDDGSFWVWIPRYVYRISTGWHNDPPGTVDIQFSMGTDDTRGGTITLDTGTTANASNNKWTNHPAFTFGSDELMGIWVAKFEASVANTSDLCYTIPNGTNCNKSNLVAKMIPNVESWRYVSIGNVFTVSRNMETNSTYGWGTSGTGIDTHLTKNSEWGAILYLSISTYGKNAELWPNNSTTYTTGCAGDSVSPNDFFGCQNAYSTTNGQQASTTGNVYGIYDINGGSYESISAYINNGHANLSTNGSNILSADAKYKDIYTVTTDDTDTNYDNTINKKGDALYETSAGNNGFGSWFGNSTYMSETSDPWLRRGGYRDSGFIFITDFYDYWGGGYDTTSFRPILLVQEGL